jgi:class 3 adenylate cyclase
VAADAVADFCRGVRQLLPAFDGEEIKSIGDAVRLPVPDAAPVIGFACVSLAKPVRGMARWLSASERTRTRVQRAGDWFGAAVNLAARVVAARSRGLNDGGHPLGRRVSAVHP